MKTKQLLVFKNCLSPTTLLETGLWRRCFSVNFAKFLRTPFLTEHLWWLFLSTCFFAIHLLLQLHVTSSNFFSCFLLVTIFTFFEFWWLYWLLRLKHQFLFAILPVVMFVWKSYTDLYYVISLNMALRKIPYFHLISLAWKRSGSCTFHKISAPGN